ncbi:MAG: hypothetical protein IJO57_02990 [Bacilli bacterium]|nr:hypothetical protein [Bacilli bacterium]
MAKEILVTAKKISKREKKYKKSKIIVTIVLLLLVLIFLILSIVYKGGNFTITLDPRLYSESGIVIYEDPELKESKKVLSANNLEFIDNISVDWLPANIHSEAYGSHNGENYIAYTFFIENTGKETINYWYSVVIDDVIKQVDEAVRIMVYLNDNRKIYAKRNIHTNTPEDDTTEFYSEKEPVVEERKDFKPEDVDKFTIVIWLEGDDPDCVDNILGGEIKMHMEIREEHKEKKDER